MIISNKCPILYSFIRCPYAIRARTALFEAGINCIVREVDLKNKPTDMLKVSPKGTVPILLLENGNVIEESLDIIYYASQDKSFSIANHSREEQRQIETLITANDTEFIKLLRPYKYPARYPDDSKEACKQQIQDQFLDKYEEMLKDNLFLFGCRSIADIAIFPFIRQLALVDVEWFYNSHYKNLITWLKKFTDSLDFKKIIMAKHEPWSRSSKVVYLFPSS